MKLSAIGIVCKNLNKSISFYESLGIKFTKSSDDHYEGISENGFRVMLDSLVLIQKINPEWKMNNSSNIVLAFEMETPLKVNELTEKLQEAGNKVQKEPWDAFWGQRYACINDPDGNQIDLFASL